MLKFHYIGYYRINVYGLSVPWSGHPKPDHCILLEKNRWFHSFSIKLDIKCAFWSSWLGEQGICMSNALVSACRDLNFSACRDLNFQKVLTVVLWNYLTIKGNGLSMEQSDLSRYPNKIQNEGIFWFTVYIFLNCIIWFNFYCTVFTFMTSCSLLVSTWNEATGVIIFRKFAGENETASSATHQCVPTCSCK